MPRFFFHLRDKNRFSRDEEGRELVDRSAAHAVAVMSARSVMCDGLLLGHVSLGGSIEVRDEGGRPIETLTFSEAVEIVE